MAAVMTNIAKTEAAEFQLEAAKARLERPLPGKVTPPWAISLQCHLRYSGVMEEPAAVCAARLAQLAARRAKRGAETSAPLTGMNMITSIT